MIHARDLVNPSDTECDALFTRVSPFNLLQMSISNVTCSALQYTQLVDVAAHRRGADPVFEPREFYGQL